jgi:hypothetical protein
MSVAGAAGAPGGDGMLGPVTAGRLVACRRLTNKKPPAAIRISRRSPTSTPAIISGVRLLGGAGATGGAVIGVPNIAPGVNTAGEVCPLPTGSVAKGTGGRCSSSRVSASRLDAVPHFRQKRWDCSIGAPQLEQTRPDISKRLLWVEYWAQPMIGNGGYPLWRSARPPKFDDV